MNHFILRSFVSTCLILIATVVLSPFDTAAQIRLAWNPVDDPSVIGYKIYYGTATRTYGTPIDAGNVATYTLNGLAPGVTYYIAVTAYNREHESGYSNEVSGTITETVGAPNALGGPVSGIIGTAYSYTAGGSSSSLGNPLEYQFDWKGDGSDLSDWGWTTQSKTWTVPGAYNVRARARSIVNYSVVSAWSPSLSVTIGAAGSVINALITPTSVNFGSVNVGHFANQTVAITNQANSTAALTGNVGTLSAPFSVKSGGGAFNLAPGQSVTITVQFSPATAGAASANLSITHKATNRTTPANISLSGTGSSTDVPVISVTSAANDYGKVKVRRSKTAFFKVKNSGNANLLVTSTIKGTDASMFTIRAGSGSKTIKPGRILIILVAFKPLSQGSKSGTFEITSNDANKPTIAIALSGIGQ